MRIALLASLILALLTIPRLALAEPTMPLPEVHRMVLDNGLTVLLIPRHQAPVISAHILYKVGSIDEPSGATGIAHLFEHMAFKGTHTLGSSDPKSEAPLLERMDESVIAQQRLERDGVAANDPRMISLREQFVQLQNAARERVVPNQFADLYQRQGGVGLNASTSADFTRYFVSFPANRLPFWALMESQRMADPVLREFYTERDVVLEERRSRIDNNPQGRLREALLASAFTAHPYGHPVLGWEADLKQMTRPQAAAFFADHYTPENIIIALAGDLDPVSTEALIKDYFSSLEKRTPAPPPHTTEPVFDGIRRVQVRFDASPSLIVAFHRPNYDHPDDPVFDVIQLILSDGISSRLHRTLVLDQGLATGIHTGSGLPGGRDDNLFAIFSSPRHPHTNAELETAILAQLTRLAEQPVSQHELLRARNRVEAGLLRSLTSNSGIARSLAFFEAATGDWRDLFRMQGQINAVSAEDVMRVAREYLNPDRRIVAELIPPSDPPQAEAAP